MSQLKSHFLFNRQQRNGILLLITVIIGLLVVSYFIDTEEEPLFDISSSEIKKLQRDMDSLREAEIENRKPKLYPFNPNYITDFKAYTLGMSSEEFDRLQKFRDRDQWINSTADFKKITKVSDSLLNKIGPYFKFPDWVKNKKPKKQRFINYNTEKPWDQKTDLNKATEQELQQISGIGETLSKRIISYRERIGGFTSDIQLYQVWGLNEAVVERTLNQFTVKTAKPIEKMNINKVSASDIATIPGISFELAKRIWEYRVLHEQIYDFSELDKIEGLTVRKLQLIQLYLFIE